MGVPTSEVGYTPAMLRREDHEVHKGHMVALDQKKYFSMRRCVRSRRRKNKCRDKAEMAVKVPGMRAWIRSVSRWMGHTMFEKVLGFWEHWWSSEPSKYPGAKGQRKEMKTWTGWLKTHWFYGADSFCEANRFSANQEIHSMPPHPTSWRSILILSSTQNQPHQISNTQRTEVCTISSSHNKVY